MATLADFVRLPKIAQTLPKIIQTFPLILTRATSDNLRILTRFSKDIAVILLEIFGQIF